jgi:predicted DNA-binding transcriptional regulator YafY
VYRQLDVLTDAIGSGKLLEVSRIKGTGRFANDPHQEQPFRIYPLQILFHNIGWYLGYECASDQKPHLFRFERLDRIYVQQSLTQQRSQAEQRQALAQLDKLYRASAGLFLGNSATDQQKYLSGGEEHKTVEKTLEIWCNDDSFRFISEGTKRFPVGSVKMSKRVGGSQQNFNKKMFCLKQTDDPRFPNRFVVKLPYWSLQGDVELLRWVVGFGGKVKVVSPVFFVDKVKTMGSEIVDVYRTEGKM